MKILSILCGYVDKTRSKLKRNVEEVSVSAIHSYSKCKEGRKDGRSSIVKSPEEAGSDARAVSRRSLAIRSLF